jgi:SNF family Na+-dependent transporter
MIISFADTFTSLLAGVTIFAILGSLATELDVDISVVAKSGPGLACVSFSFQSFYKYEFL